MTLSRIFSFHTRCRSNLIESIEVIEFIEFIESIESIECIERKRRAGPTRDVSRPLHPGPFALALGITERLIRAERHVHTHVRYGNSWF